MLSPILKQRSRVFLMLNKRPNRIGPFFKNKVDILIAMLSAKLMRISTALSCYISFNKAQFLLLGTYDYCMRESIASDAKLHITFVL